MCVCYVMRMVSVHGAVPYSSRERFIHACTKNYKKWMGFEGMHFQFLRDASRDLLLCFVSCSFKET